MTEKLREKEKGEGGGRSFMPSSHCASQPPRHYKHSDRWDGEPNKVEGVPCVLWNVLGMGEKEV
jgi:hypothetical protein